MKIDSLQTVPDVLKEFARQLGTELNNHRLEIPEKFGRGYCTGFVFNENIRISVDFHNLLPSLHVYSKPCKISMNHRFEAHELADFGGIEDMVGGHWL